MLQRLGKRTLPHSWLARVPKAVCNKSLCLCLATLDTLSRGSKQNPPCPQARSALPFDALADLITRTVAMAASFAARASHQHLSFFLRMCSADRCVPDLFLGFACLFLTQLLSQTVTFHFLDSLGQSLNSYPVPSHVLLFDCLPYATPLHRCCLQFCVEGWEVFRNGLLCGSQGHSPEI